jgi:hypothetical protein
MPFVTATRKLPKIPANPIPTTTSHPCGSRTRDAGSRFPSLPPLQSTRIQNQASRSAPSPRLVPCNFCSVLLRAGPARHVLRSPRWSRVLRTREALGQSASRQRDHGERAPFGDCDSGHLRTNTTATGTETALENCPVRRIPPPNLARQRPIPPLASLAPPAYSPSSNPSARPTRILNRR